MRKRVSPDEERATRKWIGAAAIAYGVLYFLSNLLGEFLLPAERSNGEIAELWRFLIYVGAWGLGALALVPALRALDRVYRRRGEITRAGSVGLRLAAAGAALQALFAAVYFGSAAATGDAADAAFLLFALGFLLMIAGSFTAGISLIRTGTEQGVGALLPVAAVAAVVLIVTPYPIHDVALFSFAVTWIAIGSVLVRPVRLVSRRRVLGWSSALGLLLALTVPSGAVAGAEVETIHFAGVLTAASANPCTGASGTSSVTFAGVSHTTVTPGGSLYHTATVTGEITFTPDDPHQPTYAGRFTAWDGQNGAIGATITSTATFRDTLFASDGSKIRSRGAFHLTQLADGTVTAGLETFALTCAI